MIRSEKESVDPLSRKLTTAKGNALKIISGQPWGGMPTELPRGAKLYGSKNGPFRRQTRASQTHHDLYASGKNIAYPPDRLYPEDCRIVLPI
ncbi:MAG: hypothetical protein R2787_11740 [Saprospiraceae bacterium]